MTKFWLRSVEAVLLALLVMLAVLAWRLSKGPLPLDQLAPYIENAFASPQSNVHLKIGHASLEWRELRKRPILTVEDVQARDERGVVATLPRMAVDLSLAPLLRGAIVPEEIVISSPTLRMIRRADGSFAFGFGASEAASEPSPDNGLAVGTLVGALTQPASPGNLAGYLQRVSIAHSSLLMLDEATGQKWLVPDAGIDLQRADGDVVLSATLPVVDNDKPWTIKAKGRYAASSHSLDLAFQLTDFQPAGIAPLAAQLHPLKAADLPLSGEVKVRLSLANDVARMEELTFDIKGDNGALNMPAPLNRAYGVKRLVLKGAIFGALDHIKLEQLRVDFEEGGHGAMLLATGEGTALNSNPSIVLDLGLDNITLADLKHYWPEGTKENARQWIVKNLDGGTLNDTRFHVALGGPRLEELSLSEFKGTSVLNGLAVTYMKGMPRVEKTVGLLGITSKEVGISLSDGIVPDPLTGDGVHVRNGSIRMTDLGSDHERARVTLDLAGEFGEVLRIIDHEPLGYARSMGIDANAVAGEAKVNLDIGFPLISDLKLDELAIAVKAKVDGAKVPAIAFGQPLTDSQLSMTLDRKGMDVVGKVELAGIPATLVWRENFGGGEFRSRYDVTAVLDDTQRPLVSLTSPIFAAPYVSGPVRAHVIYTARRDGTGTVEADADLREAEVAIRQLGWIKPPAAAARATVTATVTKDQLTAVSNFRLVAEDKVEIAGAAKFADDGALTGLTVTRGHVDETNLTGELTRDDTGRFIVDVRGSAFNSTYFWKELGRDDARSEASEGKTPMQIRAAFDRMWLAKEGDFRDVRLDYRQGRAGIEQINLSTNVDGQAPFTFTLGNEGGKRTFHGQGTSGGSVVRAVGLFSDIVGGALQINGEVGPDGTVKGRADIANLKVVGAPLMARLLSVAALTGILDELRGKGISFKLLRVPFTYGQSTLHIKDGEMFGTSLGLTAKGTYSFADSRMDFDGTVVPAYAINNALSNIPLIGKLLTGFEKGGGILAATYRYQGDPATAQPSLNPLAALTPGITRRIFDIFKGKPAQSAATPPPREKVTPVVKPDTSEGNG